MIKTISVGLKTELEHYSKGNLKKVLPVDF